jgi:ElaB/YqjD/DUF883 family membrane-anchored ribosome-binding protein
MASIISGNQVKLNNGQTVTAQQGGWYDGQQFWGGTLSSTGQINSLSNQIGAGQAVSKEVVDQSGSANWQFIQQQSAIDAANINQPVSLNLPSGSGQNTSGLQADVETYRSQLDTILKNQKAEADAKLAETRKREQEALGEVQKLATPFREDLENSERERLYINQNFEENQKLVNELEQLLTEGNNLIQQQQQVTGLAAVRNPRIQQTMNDVQARAGVIEAVINARNGQIAQAENLIDRSITAITNDKLDQLNYYNTVLSLANRDIVMLDAESKDIAKQQVDLIKGDLERANATVDYVKQLLLNPDTASMMGSAGVKLTDSVDQINAKLQTATYTQELQDYSNKISMQGGVAVLDPTGVPANQLVSFTDSRGQVHYYKMPATGSGSGSSSLVDSIISSEVAARLGVDQSKISTNAVVPDIVKMASDVAGPNFSPGVIGYVWTDSLGRKWQYTSTGWILLG